MGEWRIYTIHIFLNPVLAGGEWPASLPGLFTPNPIAWEAEWATEPIWMTWRGEKCVLYRDSNSDPAAVHHVAVAAPHVGGMFLWNSDTHLPDYTAS
jgi:hypothetical protein